MTWDALFARASEFEANERSIGEVLASRRDAARDGVEGSRAAEGCEEEDQDCEAEGPP